MHWLDGISLDDDNLISGRSGGASNGDSSDNNQSKAASKAKRRRHAHYKLNGRLDRKSSRGMIYENEELRLRTININAEVERGQSDIKRLRRENEHLRREIWTLRDECDRLNKRFKAKILEHDNVGCNARGSGGSGGGAGTGGCPPGCDGTHSHSNSDDSDSCDTCRGDDEHYSDNCCRDGSCTQLHAKQSLDDEKSRTGGEQHNTSNAVNALAANGAGATFDHLSVVSEETLSNSEMLAPHNEHLLGYTPDIMMHGSQTALPSLVGPLTPLTPIEMVANQLNDLQAMVPPLSYFENILAQHMGSTIGTTPESSTTTTSTGTGNTVKHTNGWDYNLQSPFAQRKNPTSSSSASTSTASRSPPFHQRFMEQQQQTLTTFVPTSFTPPTIVNTDESGEIIQSPHIQFNEPQSIETVAITTMPANMPPTLNSPKHFFAPLKPRLKINTSLANKQLIPVGSPVIPTPTTSAHQNFDPPDIYVTNGLASPYERPAMPKNSVSSNQPSPPSLPRLKSPQVSPSHRQRHHYHVHHQHQHHRHQQQQQTAAVDVTVVDVAAATGHDVVPITERLQVPQATTPTLEQHQQQQSRQQKSALLIEKPNILLTKTNEPIYAIAQKSCNILTSAPALSKPLMTATTSTTKSTKASTTASTTNLSDTTIVTETTTTAKSSAMDSLRQTDSANLESILNDIENISDDILAIQLDKNRSHENITMSNGKSLQQDDKSKKPYRSEMNLLLTYDGTNSTITPATTTAALAAQAGRTRSLEREHTDSPSPNVPDPMAPFPENRTYIGFDQLNKAVGGTTKSSMNLQLQQKPPLPPSQLVSIVGSGGSKPVTPPKPTPPTPPARMYPPPLNIRCAGVARATPMSTPQQQQQQKSFLPGSPVHGLTPNKSHLFAAIAQAAAKRAQFRALPTELSRSLDADMTIDGGGDERIGMDDGSDEATQADAARRKARRVSIICGDANSPTTPDHSSNQQQPFQTQAQTNSAGCSGGGGIITSTLPVNASTASCSDIATALSNHALRNLKQTSHSTPNSPHSTRRRSNSNSMPESALAATPASASTGAASPHHPHQHHHSHSNSNSSAGGGANDPHRKNSGTSADLVAAAAIVARSKCSRRHSDGTVASNVQRISGASGGGSGGGVAHHHSHHHHQHSSSLLSNNPHHSHHSHQDSNHETGTSLSDRNSNSLASSRESSTSFSLRSSRRKISVSSHTGGKIPWCGCWGNGCL